MIVRRGARPARYTVVDNATLSDERLTWEARGMLVYLLSKPDHWSVNRDHLTSEAPNGIAVVRRVLGELETHGYLVRRRVRGEGGRLGWEAIIYESPGQTIGASTAGGSASDGSSAGGERAALVRTEVVSTGVVSPAASAAPLALVAEDLTPTTGQRAQKLLAGYIDWCRAQTPPRATPPRPGQAAQAIRLMLDAGYEDADVKRACVAAPTITTNALEVALGRAKPERSRTGPGSTTINDAWVNVPTGLLDAKAVR